MTGLLALSTVATLALIAGVIVGLAFVTGLIVMTLRRRGEAGPDIPPGMSPGPSDQVLERRHVERIMGWGIIFVVITAVWLPVIWLREPDQNVADAVELMDRAAARGEEWFALTSEENPTGFACARCHGPNAEGGSVPFTNSQTGEFIPNYPVPALNDVCARLPIEDSETQLDIRDTIMQGREGTPMPSWSVRFEGPMNDQQITDLIAFIVSIQEIPDQENKCTNPAAAAGDDEPAAGPSPDAESA
jgi:mono/diheme cytochrome c family protein